MYSSADWFSCNLRQIVKIAKNTLKSKEMKGEVHCGVVESPNAFLPGTVVEITPKKGSDIYRIGIDAGGTMLLVVRMEPSKPTTDTQMWTLPRDIPAFQSFFEAILE